MWVCTDGTECIGAGTEVSKIKKKITNKITKYSPKSIQTNKKTPTVLEDQKNIAENIPKHLLVVEECQWMPVSFIILECKAQLARSAKSTYSDILEQQKHVLENWVTFLFCTFLCTFFDNLFSITQITWCRIPFKWHLVVVVLLCTFFYGFTPEWMNECTTLWVKNPHVLYKPIRDPQKSCTVWITAKVLHVL